MTSKWISLQHACEYYKIPEKVFYNIMEGEKVPCSLTGTEILLEKVELENYLQQNPELLKKEENRSQIATIMKNLDLAIEEAHKRDSSIFQIFIEEISLLIDDTRKRAIFLDTTINGDIKKIAPQYNMDHKAAWYQYRSAKKIVAKRIGIIKTYRKEKASWILMNRKQEIELRNLRNENEKLKEIIREQKLIREDQLSPEELQRVLSKEMVRILSVSLSKQFNLSTRLLNCLYSQGIKTVEDLFRFIKEKGFEGFHKIPLYGKRAEEELMECLEKAGLIDENGNSELFNYLN